MQAKNLAILFVGLSKNLNLPDLVSLFQSVIVTLLIGKIADASHPYNPWPNTLQTSANLNIDLLAMEQKIKVLHLAFASQRRDILF